MSEPVFGGALQSQIECLGAPIAIEACSVHPYHKWVYVSGAIVRMHLNKIFGFDGWSHEITDFRYIAPDMGNPVTKFANERGKEMYRAIAQCRVRLTIHWPGGRTTHKDGIGTSAVPQPKPEDACDMNAQAAETYALRDAAMNLGAQFGLEVMRLKMSDERGREVPWQSFTGGEPRWPDFLEEAGGAAVAAGHPAVRPVQYEAHAHQRNPGDHDGDAPVQAGQSQPAPNPANHRPPQATPKQPDARSRASASTKPTAQPAQKPQPEAPKKAIKPEQPEQPEPPVAGDGQGADLPPDYDRDAYTSRCRAAWLALYNIKRSRPMELLAEHAARFGVEIEAKMLRHPEADGGPSDLLLAALALAMESEVKG